MYYRFFIAIAFLSSFFFSNGVAHAQSCDSLKTIFENSAFCDGKWVSLHGKVYADSHVLQDLKYTYEFQLTDDDTSTIRVVSKDSLSLWKNDEVIVSGRYYTKLYADGLNLDNTIVASAKNIKVMITAEELLNGIFGPWGVTIAKEQSLKRRTVLLAILIPLFSVGAFVGGYAFYKRKKIKGSRFEGYVEDLFRKNKEWKVERDNSYRKLRKGWVESYSNPDFVFIHRKTNQKIAVECKYKEKEYERVFWAYEDQIERYQNFSTKEKIPVFAVIGIGGRPKNPKRLFLVPLHLIKYPDVALEYLRKFERDPRKNFTVDDLTSH